MSVQLVFFQKQKHAYKSKQPHYRPGNKWNLCRLAWTKRNVEICEVAALARAVACLGVSTLQTKLVALRVVGARR